MLETIKHLFDIKNLVFIISTDTAQLEHSIKAVYGNGFDSFEYLHRFFKQRVTLPKPDYYKFLCMVNAFNGIDFTEHHYYPKIDTAEKLRALVALQAETNGVELRKLENIYSQITLFLISIDSDKRMIIDMVYLVAVIFTINMIANSDMDPIKSIRRSNRIENGKTLIAQSVSITRETHGQTAIKFDKLMIDLVSEFNSFNYYTSENFKRNQWHLYNLEMGAPMSLFYDLVDGESYTYVSHLINEMRTNRSDLLSDSRLLKMINELNIHSLFDK